MNTQNSPAKTTRPHGILLSVVALTAVVVSLILWTLSSIEGIADIVRVMTRLCEGIFNQCLGYATLGRMALLWTVGLTLLTGLAVASFRAAATLIRSKRAIDRLPLKNKKANLVLIDDRNIATAFTHGIIRPRIYISRGLMAGLGHQELRAVLHHELSHKKNRDPLRFFLLSILRDILFFIPLASHAARNIRDRQERRADDMAVTHMREPFSIAGALVKLSSGFNAHTAEMASILGAHGAVEERVRRLLGEKDGAGKGKERKGPGTGAIVTSLLIPVFMLISLAMPLKGGMPARMSCTMTHCSNQKPRPEKNCRIHCDKTIRIQKPAPPKPLP